MNVPAITVLMPFHNAARHLAEAAGSVLAQTFTDFELLAIDDGSTDGGADLLAALADPRLRIERLSQNRGIVGALNHGLALARGAVIARMDADDVSEPHRLFHQIEFLREHPEIGVLGADFTPFGADAGPGWIRYHRDADLRIALLFENPLCHPTVVFRREALEKVWMRYPDGYPHAEEYALWLDLSRHTQLANLPEKLLRYRTHAGQVSRRHAALQCDSIDRLIHRQLVALGVPAEACDLRVHHLLGSGFFPRPRLARILDAWTHTLVAANERSGVYPPAAFAAQLADRRDAAIERHARTLRSMRLDQRLRWQFSSWLRA